MTTTTTLTDSVVVTTISSTTMISTSSSTVTVTVSGSCTAPAAVAKRTASAIVAKPNVFSAYSGGTLSSACSCLSVPPSTTTTTVTQTTPRRVSTKTSSVTATITNYPTATVTSIVTTAITSTSTGVTTISSVVMTATTVTVTATPSSFYLLDGTNGLYAAAVNGEDIAFSSDGAVIFNYNSSDGTLTLYGYTVAFFDGENNNPNPVFFLPTGAVGRYAIPLTCALYVGTEDCTLSCDYSGQIENSLGGNDQWYLGTSGTEENAGTEFTIYVVDAGS
ncbi:hypothetical protein BDY17DRAFT_29784 [Neohortaea acidophila]|uniref:Uncharacterized protein n=1 Tax=Neohortaea acidophila TaxID=245834 RepID=A0A6A6PJL4_9PEZI|nr:uncharacterized protein BDY17DRAFT_29784 [Neohortaea acidophila]KAF2479986.1 hypothetical protein BDY17DRAFT_29784 [Neohortaea acidophila]